MAFSKIAVSNAFADGLTLRDVLVNNISDTYKDIYGVRPRWNFAEMTLLHLWQESKYLYSYLCEILRDRYYEEMEKEWAEWDRLYEREECAWLEVCPNEWDEIADRLESR